MNKIIPLQEMIEEIKKHYNLNDTLLALNLKVTPQTVKGWKDGNIPREKTYNKILEIYNNIINSEEQTEEVTEVTEKKPYEISYPNNGEQIYYISYHSGQVKEWDFNISYEADKYLYDIGLYFDTEEEAEQFKREQTLIKKIKCWAKEQQGDWKLDWSNESQYKFTVDYSGLFEELCVRDSTVAIRFNSLPYFKSEKIAQACIDEFGDEILEVFC
jgi:hypothetical protein